MNRTAHHLRTAFYLRLFLAFSLLFVAHLARAADTYKATVTVDMDKPRTFMSPRAVGVQIALADNNLMDAAALEMIRGAGVTALRYPGGKQSDTYHWSTFKPTKWQGSEPPNLGYYAPTNDFGHFVALLDKTGATAIITVNYGSNLTGTGGGEPAEAAAWVAYANGDPSDTKDIGKDSTGYDWRTVGYWASLRCAQPLATDDGLNFLRIAHPRPLHIRYWEVGNQVYANGYYGDRDKEGGAVEDLHAPYTASVRDNEKSRNKNAKLSPEAYGRNVVEFANLMKAVDPTIKIGAGLNTLPADLTWGPDWNREVLKAVGQSIDFVVMHWYTGNLLPPDWKILDPAALLDAPQTDLPKITSALLEQLQKYCGSNAQNMQWTVAEFGPQPWAKLEEPLLKGLFAADAYVSLMEAGVANANWADVHNGFLDSNNKPAPAYFGLQMARILLNPNDTFVNSASNKGLLTVHAAKRADGGLGLMLVNKDSARSATVTITVNGAKLSASGMRFDFGKSSPAALARTQVSDVGNTFTVTVPPYTVTDFRIPKAQ